MLEHQLVMGSALNQEISHAPISLFQHARSPFGELKDFHIQRPKKIQISFNMGNGGTW